MVENLYNEHYITFKRPNNVIKGMWFFIANDWIMWSKKIKITSTLILLSLTLLAALILLFVQLGKGFLYALILFSIYFFFELILYSVARKSKIFQMASIALGESDVIICNKNGQKETVSYEEIKKLKFSNYTPAIVVGGLIGKNSYWHRHFVITYLKNGAEESLLLPLDISDVPKIIKLIIEKTGSIKIQENKLDLTYSWRRPQGENVGIAKNNDISIGTVDPNANIGKPVLILLILLLIGFFIWRSTWK